ncbi:outer membrane beta-barrel protein [Hyphobacterium sp. CCMP332]|nr:outer membrane beta-barrel protein [Hyphobacterium sp. CCMP332]
MKKVNFNLKLIMVIGIMAGLLFNPQLSNAGNLEEPDTVTIKIGKSKLIFLIENEEDLESLEDYDVNEIIKGFKALLDSTESGNTVTIDEKEKNIKFIEIQTGNGIIISDKHKKKKRITNHLYIDFGLNNMVEKNAQISSQPYRLNNWSSRYFALSSMKKVRLGQNKGPANFQFGAEITWNNLMFEDDITLRKMNGISEWVDYMDPSLPGNLRITNDIPARKGKLAIATIGLPLLIGFDLGKDDNVKIAAGAYVNYKLSSWTKTVYFEEGDRKRVKDRSDYNLNDWRYGLMATFSYKGLSIFGKYDLSPLFNTNPELNGNPTGDFNVYSFGIRI